MSCSKYQKGEGTSGIRGQLYETKLISLIFYRAKHDDSIEDFKLASNVDQIGAFDDVCFKAKVKGFDKPVTVSIQAKHKDDKNQTLTIDLTKYFHSYLKIRERSKPSYKDELFQGSFEETECFFVIYTSGKDNFGDAPVESVFASKLNDLIDTGGTAKQPYKHTEDMELLCKVVMNEQITSLAEQIVAFMSGEGNVQMMLSDDLMLRYHVILAQRVFDISETKPDGHRVASFRQDFFDTNEEYLLIFKDTLYKEVLKRRKIKSADVKKLLSEFLAEPTDVTRLSKLIGTVIEYNNGLLEFVKKSKDFKQQLKQVSVSLSTVNKAIHLAAREILSSKEFKVPAAFGNRDLTIRGNEAKIEKRLNHLLSKLTDLVDNCTSSNIVTVDESLEEGLLQLNGGLASAIGNMFVLDDDTKLLKITDDRESLGDLAKRLYKKFKSEIHNLHEYKFCVKVKKFPKLSLDSSEYEENLARDFLSKLLFYSNQADEKGVEEILKSDIEDHQLDHVDYFQAKIDAMFLKYHDEIQKWWMRPKDAPYLTKDSEIFETAINSIIRDPLLSVLNVMYMNKIKHIDYTFTDDAVKSLKLQDQHSSSVIIAENSELAVVKVMQYLKNKDHVVLDLEYIVNLTAYERNALCIELTNTNNEKVLVFVCDKIKNSINEKKTLEHIAKAVLDKQTIVITNSVSAEILHKYFPKPDCTVHDERNRLNDMNDQSQRSILKTTRVMFQGKEVELDLIVDDESKAYVKGDVLNKILSEETVVVSKLIVDRNFEEMKHLYVDRRVKKTRDDVDIVVQTLCDITDDVVFVTAEPGMGKSTLLTHLSLETKEVVPEVWIVRINLLEYSREFNKWKQDETGIDSLETLYFMCQVILREQLGKDNKVEIKLQEENGATYLKQCTGDQWTVFELNLFLHYYNKRKIIFLFDGFDEICPHYSNVVLKCLKSVSYHSGKHQVWVTSRSYNEVKIILQREFGLSYEIENFSYSEKEEYLEKIWKSNLILKEFDAMQLKNLHSFFEFMSKTDKRDLRLFEVALHDIYVNAGCYLVNEIKRTNFPLWSFDEQDLMVYHQYFALEKLDIIMNSYYYKNSDKNPLHLFLRANFLINNLKSLRKDTDQWNRDVNTFTFYKQYLETKLKKIRYEDKNKMDIYNPDIMIAYDKELADFIAKHKKLAAYAMFNEHIDKLFSKKDLEEIKETIKFMENGGEKTGLIYSAANIVTNEIPIFIHTTFAEYFAVEHVCDCLKSENDTEKQKPWMDFIFKESIKTLFIKNFINVMFSKLKFNVRNSFDYKMKDDKILMRILETHKEVIFHLLMKQGVVYSTFMDNFISMSDSEKEETSKSQYWQPSSSDVAKTSLNNFTALFISTFKTYINESNFKQFLDIVKGTKLLCNAGPYEANTLKTFFVCIFDIIKKYDKSVLSTVLHQILPFLSNSTLYDEMTSEEIVDLIYLEYFKERYNGDIPPNTLSDNMVLHLHSERSLPDGNLQDIIDSMALTFAYEMSRD